jgi:hypothetical protein
MKHECPVCKQTTFYIDNYSVYCSNCHKRMGTFVSGAGRQTF